jgi:hypothetical protein
MALTISQLQQMYGTKVHELRGREPQDGESLTKTTAAKTTQSTQVVTKDTLPPLPKVTYANSFDYEIIPDDDNPLFMNIEQRAEAAAKQEADRAEAERRRIEQAYASLPSFKWAPGKTLQSHQQENMQYIEDHPELFMTDERYQSYLANKAEEEKRQKELDAIAATLPPRPAGALGEDLRLTMRNDIEKATFLEEMKIKYQEYKDAFNFNGDRNEYTFGGKVTTPVMRNAKAGNSFVLHIYAHYLSGMEEKQEAINHQKEMIIHNQKMIEQGSITSINGLSSHRQALQEKQDEYERMLAGLKSFAEGKNVTKPLAAFFADYTRFTTGKAANLEQLYREYGIA